MKNIFKMPKTICLSWVFYFYKLTTLQIKIHERDSISFKSQFANSQGIPLAIALILLMVIFAHADYITIIPFILAAYFSGVYLSAHMLDWEWENQNLLK